MKNKNICIQYFIICFISLILLGIELIFNIYKIIPFILFPLGILIIVYSYKNRKTLISPITIFSLIWLILVSLTSFDFPLMRAMNLLEWKLVLIFCTVFSFGGILASFININIFGNKEIFKRRIKFISYLILVLSIVSYLILFLNFGGIPLFSKDANAAKILFKSHEIWSFLSCFGGCSIILLLLNDNDIIKNKIFIILSFIYLALIILSGERFLSIIIILFYLLLHSKKELNIKNIKIMLFVTAFILLVFFFVLLYRGNSEQKNTYFVKTGIYYGDPKKLSGTEIFRYIGMQQRILSNTINFVEPGYTKGSLTFAPLLKIFGKNSIPIPDIQIYGYTAKSIITKSYCDFGKFWPLAILLLSMLINIFYNNVNSKSSIIYQYINIALLIVLTLSFYAYFDNYIILFMHYIIYILFMKFINLFE